MIKSLRNKVISILTLIACVMFAMLIGVSANFVKADEVVDTNVFTMYNTASIRTDKDPAGIRFSAKLGLEKFKALAGEEEGASINVVFTANKAGADVSLEKTKTYTVTAEDFANDEDGIINIMYTLTFDNAWDDAKKQEAYAMSLTVGCKAYKGETKVADLGAITQDARAVASFNDLIDGTEAYKGYYTSANMVDGVAPYVAGTVGTRIYIDGLTTDYSNIYVNTTKVNATVNNGFVTIAKADMAKLLTTAPKNIIQAIDANGNVIAKELTEVVDTYAETVTFSAMDGDIDYSKILGNETVTGVEVVSSTAEQTSTIAFAENKLTGLATIRAGYTDVVIKVVTEYSAKLVNLKVATKIIDEADDLQVFAIKQRDDTETGSDAIDGYFVLANDIDATGVVIKHRFSDYGYNVYPQGNYDLGFTGVLDGNGYQISNFTAQSSGLFGRINPSSSGKDEGMSIIKNIAFINALCAPQNAASSVYPALFAHTLAWATFENVYIDYAFTTTNKGYNYLFASNNTTKIELKNVVVEADFEESFVDKHAILTADKQNGIQDYTVGEKTVNTYFITKSPVFIDANMIGVAGNVTIDEDYLNSRKFATSAASKYYFDVLKSYDTRADMMKDKDANADSLATFSDDYWMIFNGVPLWKGTDNFVAVSDSEIVNVDTPANLSLLDKKGNAVDGVKVTVSGEGAEYVTVEGMQIRVPATYVISQNYDLTAMLTVIIDDVEVVKTVKLSVIPATGKTINSVYVEADGTLVGLSAEDATLLTNANYDMDGNALTFSDGKFDVSAFANKTLGEYYVITANANGKSNTLNFRYVTKAIDEAEDLKVFQIVPHSYDETSGKSLGSDPIYGYYVLTKHIDANGLTLKHTWHDNLSYPDTSKDKGFKGVFDGQGYTISNFTAPSTGLFGRIDVRDNPGCGIIKNVAFINAKVSTSGYSQILAHHAMGNDNSLFVENVYIDFQVMARGGYALFGNGTYFANIKNVVVKATINETITGSYYGFTDLYATPDKTFKTVSNAFIIGDFPVSYENSLKAVAGNSTDTTETILLTVNGIKSYVDTDAMKLDATANATALDAMVATGYFTAIDGIPAWANMPTANA